MKRSLAKKYILAIIGFAILVFIDQWTKQLAVSHLMDQGNIILIPGVLQLHYLENTGAAFSIMENKTIFFCIITPILCALMICLFIKLPDKKEYGSLRLILVFLLAGAIGNFIDRISYHYVIDFIYFSLINFPVFNVADLYVTCGVICLFFLILFVYSDKELDEISAVALGRKKERK